MRRILIAFIVIAASIVMSAQSETPTPTPQGAPTPINSIVWSPDGTQIAIGGGPYSCDSSQPSKFDVRIIDAQTGLTVQTLTNPRCPIQELDWSPDGTQLAAASNDGYGVTIWDVLSGKVIALDARGEQGVTSVKWSPTGDTVAIAYMDNWVAILDPDTGEHLSDIFLGGSKVDWNIDGNRLAIGNFDSGSVLIHDLSDETQDIRLLGNLDNVRDVEWSPDGTKIASAGGDSSVRIWDGETGNSLFFYIEQNDHFDAITWRPDGKQLATASHNGKVKIWSAETGDLLETFTYTGSVYALDWSPDSTKIAYGGADTSGNPPEVVIVDAPELPETP